MNPTLEALILIGAWIAAHIMLLGILHQRARVTVFIVSGLVLCSAYLLKPAVGDLWTYSFFFDTGYGEVDHEKNVAGAVPDRRLPVPGGHSLDHVHPDFLSGEPYDQTYRSSPLFNWITEFSAGILPHGSKWPRFTAFGFRAVSDWFLLEIILLGLAGLWLVLRMEKEKSELPNGHINFYEWLPVALGSVFFFVGSQNSVRQFLAVIAVLGFVAAFRKRLLIVAAIMALVAVLTHKFGVVLLGLATGISIGRLIIDSKSGLCQKRKYLISLAFGLFLGIIGVMVLKGSVWVGFDMFSQYIFIDDADESHRTGALPKLFLVGLVVLISEIIFGQQTDDRTGSYRQLRLISFFAVAPLVIFDEIFSRILMWFFAIEMVLIVMAVTSQKRRHILGGLVIFLAYSVAPNVFNLLVGYQWRAAFQNLMG